MLKQWSELAAIEFALDIYRCDRYSGLIQALSWSKTQNPDFCIFGVLYSYLLSDLLFASQYVFASHPCLSFFFLFLFIPITILLRVYFVQTCVIYPCILLCQVKCVSVLSLFAVQCIHFCFILSPGSAFGSFFFFCCL